MFESPGATGSASYFLGLIGSCVEQTQVSQGVTMQLGQGGGRWSEKGEEEGAAWNKRLKMCFLNVCGWSEMNGGQLERTVQKLDMWAQVISYYRPDVLALVET